MSRKEVLTLISFSFYCVYDVLLFYRIWLLLNIQQQQKCFQRGREGASRLPQGLGAAGVTGCGHTLPFLSLTPQRRGAGSPAPTPALGTEQPVALPGKGLSPPATPFLKL